MLQILQSRNNTKTLSRILQFYVPIMQIDYGRNKTEPQSRPRRCAARFSPVKPFKYAVYIPIRDARTTVGDFNPVVR
jgi:hypothetical protein